MRQFGLQVLKTQQRLLPLRQVTDEPSEDPAVRERFESELAKRGLKSVIPDEAYTRKDYEFTPVPV